MVFCLAKLSTFDISFFSKALFVSVHYVLTSEYMISIGCSSKHFNHVDGCGEREKKGTVQHSIPIK